MRRSHKKSRGGCLGCKKRHIKCDESKPECVNCVTAGARCSFNDDTHLHVADAASDQRFTPASAATPAATPASDNNGSNHGSTPLAPSGTDLNLDHLELLHHFCTVTASTLSDDPEIQHLWRYVFPRRALSFPFLMYEILAVGALHLGYLRSDHREHYYHKATELQNSAMAGFHAIEMKVAASNCVAVLCFSSMLALQVLADQTPTLGLNSSGYIDYFSQCIKLMQGTRVLVVEKWWPHVAAEPELFPLWQNVPSEEVDLDQIPHEVTLLTKLTNSTALSDDASSAYGLAIEKLQWLYKISEIPHRTYTTVRWLLAWPVLLKTAFLNLLDERRPEALVVLAYYGALLHFYRDCWVVRDTGARLVGAVNEHLGSYWEDWMWWPCQITKM